MRIQLQLTPNTAPVPFNYQHLLYERLEQWLGEYNLWHDNQRLYCFGGLHKGHGYKGALTFPDGANWFLSGIDKTYLKYTIERLLADPELIAGMKITHAELQPPPQFGKRHSFFLSSPVLLKESKTRNNFPQFITYRDGNAADRLLKKSLQEKLEEAGRGELQGSFRIRFSRNYPRPKTKLITLRRKNGTTEKNRASLCPVEMTGPPEALQLAWSVGVGESTGMGFGALLK